jgi:DNA-binding NtrC family response regulator
MNPTSDKILVVDDEVNMLALFRKVLSKEGYQVEAAPSGEEAVKLMEKEWFDLIISDLRMPGLDGLQLLKKVKEVNPAIPFIVLTAYGTIDSAVAAMRDGAYDYLTKPVNNEEIRLTVRKALELHHLTREVERLRGQVEIESDFKNIIGHSSKMRSLFRLIKLVANSNTTILIHGESGTGKELVARASSSDMCGGRLPVRSATKRAFLKRPTAARCFWMRLGTPPWLFSPSC